MFIIDTNVISDLRVPSRISPQVLAWSNSMRPASFYISAITVLELERGTQSKERKDQVQGKILREWLDGVVLANYEGVRHFCTIYLCFLYKT